MAAAAPAFAAASAGNARLVSVRGTFRATGVLVVGRRLFTATSRKVGLFGFIDGFSLSKHRKARKCQQSKH